MTDIKFVGTEVSKEVAEHFLLAEDGSHVQIQSFWKEQTALLIFVRHFG